MSVIERYHSTTGFRNEKSIGIKGIIWFYNNYDEAVNILQMIVNYYNYSDIDMNIFENKKEVYIHFKNGDTWKLLDASKQNNRGAKCNIAYLDKTIDDVNALSMAKFSIIDLPFGGKNYF